MTNIIRQLPRHRHCEPLRLALALGFVCAHAPGPGSADESGERFAIHGQITYVEQGTDSFAAPYSGPNSLSPDSSRETVDATLFIGSPPGAGGGGWVGAGSDQGVGV